MKTLIAHLTRSDPSRGIVYGPGDVRVKWSADLLFDCVEDFVHGTSGDVEGGSFGQIPAGLEGTGSVSIVRTADADADSMSHYRGFCVVVPDLREAVRGSATDVNKQ